MFPVLQLGPLALQVPGLAVLAGLWLGLILAELQLKRAHQPVEVDSNTLYNLVFVGILAGAAGARLSYVIRYPQAFAASPLSLFSLNPSLLDPSGGAAAALIACLIYGQRKNLPFWPVLDALTPALAVTAVGFGVSHLASGKAFGAPSGLPWAINLWGAERHPAQVYEILAALLILAFIMGAPRHRFAVPGTAFLTFLALSAAARLILEPFRGDSHLLLAGLRTAQVLAWFVLAGCLAGLSRLTRRPHQEPSQP